MMGSIRSALLVLAVSASAVSAQGVANVPDLDVWVEATGSWTKAHLSASPESYVMVVRVSRNGDIDVLYPETPGAMHPIRGSRLVSTASVRSVGTSAAAQTRIFAFASYTPFNFSAVTSGGTWSPKAMLSLPGRDAEAVAFAFLEKVMPDPNATVRIEETFATSRRISSGRYGDRDQRLHASYGFATDCGSRYGYMVATGSLSCASAWQQDYNRRRTPQSSGQGVTPKATPPVEPKDAPPGGKTN